MAVADPAWPLPAPYLAVEDRPTGFAGEDPCEWVAPCAAAPAFFVVPVTDLFRPLCDGSLGFFKFFKADDAFVVPFIEELVKFAPVLPLDKPFILECLLVEHVPGVSRVFDDRPECPLRPFPAVRAGDAFLIQCLCNNVHPGAG